MKVLFSLTGQLSFSRVVRPLYKHPICQPVEEVAVRAVRGVSAEVNINSALIAGDPQGILGQKLVPHSFR